MATAKERAAIAAWLVLAGIIVTVTFALGSVFNSIAADPPAARVVVQDRDTDNEFDRACSDDPVRPSRDLRDRGTCRPVHITVPRTNQPDE
jgi:hypothetical protein